MSRIAVALLIVLYGAALFAGFFCPYPPLQEFREHFFHPPSKIHFRDPSGKWTRPYVGQTYLVDPVKHVFLEGSPVYVAVLASDLNLNPYIAESAGENLTVTILTEKGIELGKITDFKESGENTGVFLGMTAIQSQGMNAILIKAQGERPIVSISSEARLFPPATKKSFPLDRSGSTAVILKPTISQYQIHFFVDGPAYKLLGFIPFRFHLFGVDEPAHIFLLGSDQSGRDIFSRTLYAARISLTIAVLGVLVTSLLGWFIGSVAGFHGGRTDTILMRITEILMAVPSLYLILAVRNIFPLHVDSRMSYLLMIIVLSFTGWAAMSRIIRGMVFSLREEQFILAVQSQGATFSRILIRHLMPATAGFVIVRATLLIPAYILAEVALSFLGIGIQEPVPSWGNMLSVAQDIRVLTQFPWTLAPGAVLFIAILAFNFLGESFRRKFALQQHS